MKSNVGRIGDRASLPLRVLYLVAATLGFSMSAQAQVTTVGDATPGLSCAYSRGATGCTANDFVGTVAATSNNIVNCTNGTTVTGVSITFSLSSSNAQRYDVGLFFGEQGLSPGVNPNGTPPNKGSTTCSVRTFPTSPAPWQNLDNNACGDYTTNSSSMEEVDNVTLLCQTDSSGHLIVPFTVVYSQNSNTCTGPTDVTSGAPSKCGNGTTPVTNVVVQFRGDPTCNKTLSYDPNTLTVTSTITITNLGGPNSVDTISNTGFSDTVPAPITVTGAVCGNAQGGGVCPASVNVAGNVVSGSVPTLPIGGSVDITITGTVPPGSHDAITNTATVIPDSTTIDANPNNNSCSNNQLTLPVRLQSFEVR